MINNVLPIVFCHGLPGWRNDELCGYPYFVCAHDLKEIQGDEFPPFLFSLTESVYSLHNQVCELFFQRKNGLTGYVRELCAKYRHNRYTGFSAPAGALTVQFLCMIVKSAEDIRNRNKKNSSILDFHMNQRDCSAVLQLANQPHKYRKKEEMQFHADLVTHILRTRK